MQTNTPRHTHTHTLGSTEAVAPSGNKLVSKASDKWAHELALKRSRSVKMSPQIASGPQMSPLHSPPHLCLRQALLLCTLVLICLCFSAFLSICSASHCPHVCPVIPYQGIYFYLFKRPIARTEIFLSSSAPVLPVIHVLLHTFPWFPYSFQSL